MAKLVASMVPFVGVITAGGSVLLDLKSSIQAEYQLETNRTHAERALNFGVPAAAMQAVVRALERERNAEAFSLSVSLGAFGAKLAGLLADGGTATTAAVGLAASVLKLTNIVRIVYRDVRERKAGNDLMTRSLKISAFETCPIIGAYYVCCAEDASLLNEILQRGGSPLDNLAEARFNLQKHVKPLQDQARRIIQAHRFVIPDLEARVLARTNEDADLGTVVSGWTKMAAASRPPVLRQNAMANPRH
jgi:hypothetical protein